MNDNKKITLSFLLALFTQFLSRITNIFVAQVEGKGLSTNDFDDAAETKLNGIEAGAEVNILEAITVNGGATTVSNKSVNLVIPTDNASLANGAGYQTSAQVSSAIDSAIATAVASAVIYKGSVANKASLPSTNLKNGDMYNVEDTGINTVYNATTETWDDYAPFVSLDDCVKKSEIVVADSNDVTAIINGLFPTQNSGSNSGSGEDSGNEQSGGNGGE